MNVLTLKTWASSFWTRSTQISRRHRKRKRKKKYLNRNGPCAPIHEVWCLRNWKEMQKRMAQSVGDEEGAGRPRRYNMCINAEMKMCFKLFIRKHLNVVPAHGWTRNNKDVDKREGEWKKYEIPREHIIAETNEKNNKRLTKSKKESNSRKCKILPNTSDGNEKRNGKTQIGMLRMRYGLSAAGICCTFRANENESQITRLGNAKIKIFKSPVTVMLSVPVHSGCCWHTYLSDV